MTCKSRSSIPSQITAIIKSDAAELFVDVVLAVFIENVETVVDVGAVVHVVETVVVDVGLGVSGPRCLGLVPGDADIVAGAVVANWPDVAAWEGVVETAGDG